MKRGDLVSFAAVLILTLFAAGVFWIVPAHAEPSRLYPYTGAVYRVENGLYPRVWAELGTAYSLGPLAPSVTLQAPLTGKFAPAVEVRLRVKL